MKIARRLLLGLPLAVLLVLAVACDTGDDGSDSDAASQGIQVTGSGSVSVTPDVALLSLGVETLADSVADARGRGRHRNGCHHGRAAGQGHRGS